MRHSYSVISILKEHELGTEESRFDACLISRRWCLVGARGFEPPTTATPLRCATRLRYAPNCERILDLKKIGKPVITC